MLYRMASFGLKGRGVQLIIVVPHSPIMVSFSRVSIPTVQIHSKRGCFSAVLTVVPAAVDKFFYVSGTTGEG